MNRAEFDATLNELHLKQKDVARLLHVTERTVRRWAANPEEMCGPARVALRAWVRCQRNGLDWADRIGWRNIYATLAEAPRKRPPLSADELFSDLFPSKKGLRQ